MSGEDTLESLLVAEEPLRLKSALLSGLHSLYRCFYETFESYVKRSRFDRSGTELALWTLLKVVYACQLVSLTYPPALPSWSSYRWWVYAISITRADFVFATLGVATIGYIIALCVAGLPLVAFLCLLCVEGKKGPSSVRLRFVFVYAVRAAYLLYLPALSVTIAVQKYTLSSASAAPEYLGISCSSLQFPVVGTLSFLFSLLLVAWAVLHSVLSYDPFYTRRYSSLSARAHSRLEAANCVCHGLLTLSHFLLQESNRGLHLSLCAVTGFSLALCHFFYLPFYNRYANFAAVMTAFILGWVGVAQLVGTLLNSTASFFVLTIVIPPPGCLLCWDFLRRREEWVLGRYLKYFPELNSPYFAELAIRLLIFQSMDQRRTVPEEKSAEVLGYLQKLTGKFRTSKFAALSEFLYVYSVQDHEGLARLHLSKARRCGFDFEMNYNLFRFEKLLQEHSRQYYEEVDYVRFRGMYDSAKKADEDACVLELEFWEELSSEAPLVKSIETMSVRLYDSINYVRKLSMQLLKQYPQNTLALKLYGTFLIEIYNDTEKGQELLSRGISQDTHSVAHSRFSYFDDSNGIMLVTAHGENLGCISYLNAAASQLLGIPQRLAHSMNIASFIPDCVIGAKKHNVALQRFASLSRGYEAQVPSHLVVLNSQSLLVEVQLQVRCMALDADPFFIVVMKRAESDREVAIYDESGVIQEHTAEFAVAVGFSDLFVSLKGCALRQLFPEFETYVSEKGKVHLYKIPRTVNELFLRLVDVQVGSRVIREVQVTGDLEECKDWGADAKTLQERAQPPLVEQHRTIEGRPKGILKAKNADKNPKHITFNLNPEVFEIGVTDFTPGKHVNGKVKDATPLKKEQKEAEAEVEATAFEPEIIDLKDFVEMAPGSSDASPCKAVDKVSKFSDLISLQFPASDKKQSATSVASSAVSSNASFTSSHTAQLLLKNVNTAMSRFKIAFVLTHIVVVAAVLSMMLYLSFITERYLRLLDVTHLSDQRIVVVNIAQDVRMLQLHAQGVARLSDEDAVRGKLGQSVDELDGIIEELTARVKDWRSGRPKALYLDDSVPEWEKHDDTVTFAFVNLLNFLKAVVTHTVSILQTPTSRLTTADASFYFLYQNAFGTGAKAMNESVHWFIEAEYDSLESDMNLILILSGTTLLLLAVFFLGVICPVVISVERANQSVWSFFYTLPLDVVQEMCFRSEGRLEATHGLEPEPREDELGKFKNLEDRERIKCTRRWPAVLTRMLLYYTLTIGFFVFFYYEGYLACFALLANKPRVENWAGERALDTASAYFWLQEVLRSNSSQQYYSLTQNQLHFSVAWEVRWYADALGLKNRKLTVGKYAHWGRSSQHEEILFADGCVGQPANCSESGMVKGLHAAVHSYILDLRSGFLTDLPATSLDKEVLQAVSRGLQSAYDSQLRSDLSQKLQLVVGVTVLYVVLSAGFYFFVYLPMANGVRRAITHTWELARIIPIDLVERILKSMRNRGAKKADRK